MTKSFSYVTIIDDVSLIMVVSMFFVDSSKVMKIILTMVVTMGHDR